MRISYNKLWKLLIDKNMKKQDLQEVAGISASSIAKLGRGANITTDVLLKSCEALACRIGEGMNQLQIIWLGPDDNMTKAADTPFPNCK